MHFRVELQDMLLFTLIPELLPSFFFKQCTLYVLEILVIKLKMSHDYGYSISSAKYHMMTQFT